MVFEEVRGGVLGESGDGNDERERYSFEEEHFERREELKDERTAVWKRIDCEDRGKWEECLSRLD